MLSYEQSRVKSLGEDNNLHIINFNVPHCCGLILCNTESCQVGRQCLLIYMRNSLALAYINVGI
jgi:hypothetical protein